MKAKGTYWIQFSIACIAIAVCTIIGLNPYTGSASQDTTPAGTLYVSRMLAERSLDDLLSLSEVAVVGTVTGYSDAFQIKNVSGQIANFTDCYFELTNILKGSLSSDFITIRLSGGAVGNYEEIYEGEPNLEKGKEYLLFLYQPGRGGGYNTEGDYYYVLGASQGVFTETEDGVFISEFEDSVRLDDFASVAVALSDENADGNYFRNEYIENQKINLESGVITQETYNELMANIDKYATIIK